MKIEYDRCDFCGKKIDGRFTGHYKYQLVSSLTTFDTNRSEVGALGVVDICQNCLEILKDFSKKRCGKYRLNTD